MRHYFRRRGAHGKGRGTVKRPFPFLCRIFYIGQTGAGKEEKPFRVERLFYLLLRYSEGVLPVSFLKVTENCEIFAKPQVMAISAMQMEEFFSSSLA